MNLLQRWAIVLENRRVNIGDESITKWLYITTKYNVHETLIYSNDSFQLCAQQQKMNERKKNEWMERERKIDK
jgi:hypothetical protein